MVLDTGRSATHPAGAIRQPHHGTGPRSWSALRTVVSAFGVVVAFAGLEHGIGEMLQGPTAPPSWAIESWAGVEAFDILAGEPAMTLVPNLLVAGILTVTASVVIAVWAIWFVGEPRGGLVLIALSLVLLFVGGGFSPPLIGVVLGLAATRIHAASPRPPGPIGSGLAPLWPRVTGIGIAAYLGLFPGLVIASLWAAIPDAVVYVLAGTAIGGMIVALVAARYADRLGSATLRSHA